MDHRNRPSWLLVAILATAGLLAWPASAAAADTSDGAAKAVALRLAPDLDMEGPAGKAASFLVRLYGGYSRVAAGDLNDGLDGYYELIELIKDPDTETITGGFSPLKSGIDFGADLIYQITPRIGIGLGAGYLRASMSSLATLTRAVDAIDYTANAVLSAVPIRLGLFLTLPVGEKLNLTAGAGAAYYAALKFEGTRGFEYHNGGWYELVIRGSRSSFADIGVQGSLGLEYMISPRMGFFVEALGRYARFKNFERVAVTSSTNSNPPLTGEGKLYVVQIASGTGTFSLFTVEETPPVDSPPDEIYTEPKIDLSGFSLQAGFRVRF